MKKVLYIISALIILGGIGLLGYPSFANYINQTFANKEISAYDDTIEKKSEEEINRLIELANRYNSLLPGSYPADPFSGENITNFKGTDFETFFMVQEDEILGYVEAPGINVYLPIYYGTSEIVLDKGAGLVKNTSLPVGGPGTHAVVSAHTGMASRKLFTDLPEMKEGDIFFIHVLNRHLAYKVNQIKVVLPEESDDLLIEMGKDYVTLLTCTPFGVNDHRLLVRGERIEDFDFEKYYAENNTAGENFAKERNNILWLVVLTVLMIIIEIIIIKKIRNKLRNRDKEREGGAK